MKLHSGHWHRRGSVIFAQLGRWCRFERDGAHNDVAAERSVHDARGELEKLTGTLHDGFGVRVGDGVNRLAASRRDQSNRDGVGIDKGDADILSSFFQLALLRRRGSSVRFGCGKPYGAIVLGRMGHLNPHTAQLGTSRYGPF